MRDIEESLFQDIATVIKLVLTNNFTYEICPRSSGGCEGAFVWEKENLKQTGAIRLLKFVVSAEVRILILPLLFITHIRCFRFIYYVTSEQTRRSGDRRAVVLNKEVYVTYYLYIFGLSALCSL